MLETKPPREQSGRDTLARYRAQACSAAVASLAILEGKEVDRIYCDLHDDFVVRINRNGTFLYEFYQVKTKRKTNYNWKPKEIFGLNPTIKDPAKQSDKAILESFAGKLLIHTVNFGENCEAVIFQTNINVNDTIEDVIADIKGGSFKHHLSQALKERFPTCFSSPDLSPEEVEANLQKLDLQTDTVHLKLENGIFGPIAREAIFRFSEIDLTHDQVNDILIKLIELVQSKSSGVIHQIDQSSIEQLSAISIADLLNVLSISEGAYTALSTGGDDKAVKNASIIQRTLSLAGANDEQIEYCSRCKIKWDKWFKDNRHILPEWDVIGIQTDLGNILEEAMANNQLDFRSLRIPIQDYLDNEVSKKEYALTPEEVLGGVMARLVRLKR